MDIKVIVLEMSKIYYSKAKYEHAPQRVAQTSINICKGIIQNI